MRKEIYGIYYRLRRGKLVEIPSEWVGKVTTPCTMRNRQSKKPKRGRTIDRGGVNLYEIHSLNTFSGPDLI